MHNLNSFCVLDYFICILINCNFLQYNDLSESNIEICFIYGKNVIDYYITDEDSYNAYRGTYSEI